MPDVVVGLICFFCSAMLGAFGFPNVLWTFHPNKGPDPAEPGAIKALRVGLWLLALAGAACLTLFVIFPNQKPALTGLCFGYGVTLFYAIINFKESDESAANDEPAAADSHSNADEPSKTAGVEENEKTAVAAEDDENALQVIGQNAVPNDTSPTLFERLMFGVLGSELIHLCRNAIREKREKGKKTKNAETEAIDHRIIAETQEPPPIEEEKQEAVVQQKQTNRLANKKRKPIKFKWKPSRVVTFAVCVLLAASVVGNILLGVTSVRQAQEIKQKKDDIAVLNSTTHSLKQSRDRVQSENARLSKENDELRKDVKTSLEIANIYADYSDSLLENNEFAASIYYSLSLSYFPDYYNLRNKYGVK